MDARKLNLSTDTPIDKIVGLYSGSFTIAAGMFNSVDVAHGLPFIPLVMGNWTNNASWNTAYEFESGPIAPPNNYSPFLYGITVTANSQNIIVFGTNYISSSPVTVHYRLFVFAPSNQTNAEISETSSIAESFYMNSEYNYTKLLGSGIIPKGTVTGSSTETIEHDLGYRPQLVYWVERDGVSTQILQAQPGNGGIAARVTENAIIFEFVGSLAANVHWRMYLDE